MTNLNTDTLLVAEAALVIAAGEQQVSAIARAGLILQIADKADPDGGLKAAIAAFERALRAKRPDGRKGLSEKTAENYGRRARFVADHTKNIKGFTPFAEGDDFETFANRNLPLILKYWEGKAKNRVTVNDIRSAGPGAVKGKPRKGKGGNPPAPEANAPEGNAMSTADTVVTFDTVTLVNTVIERLGKGEIIGDNLALLSLAVADAIKAEKAKAAEAEKAAA